MTLANETLVSNLLHSKVIVIQSTTFIDFMFSFICFVTRMVELHNMYVTFGHGAWRSAHA